MTSYVNYSNAQNWSELPLASWYPTLLRQKTPLSIALCYLIFVKLYSYQLSKHSLKSTQYKPSFVFKSFIILHNLALMLFSLCVFLTLLPNIVNSVLNSNSFRESFCDTNGKLWDDGLYFCTWLFYISKYYEFVDTLILLLKGRIPSLLQSYHHSGAVIGMWTLTYTSNPTAWIFVLLNSFIHTIMYFYYFLTTLGYKPSFKRYITKMQIGQFISGIMISIPYFILDNCINFGQKLSLAFNILYVVPLIYLFTMFSRETYSKKKKTE